MSNSYYIHTTYPAPNAPGASAALRAELEKITQGFDKLPALTIAAANKVVLVNGTGTALTTSSSLSGLAITNSTIDSSPIGASVASTGRFTNLTVTGNAILGSSVTIAGGTINNTQIGNTTPTSAAFTTASASSGFTGNLTGNVTGNVVGNVTGNLTGNVTAASGTSTFNNVTINGTLDMDAGSVGTITGLPDPTLSSDAANKSYVDTQDALKLSLSGGTMSGAIAMGGSKITGLGTPTANGDATTKTYVDTADALKLNLTGGTMSGAIAMSTNRVTGLGDPVNAQDAATKNYVDSVAQGLDVKPSVRAATTGNITLSGAQTIDGVSVVAGDRVLVKDQSSPANNGIYVAALGGWTRATDADAWAELPGAFVFVEEGTVNDNSGWVCTVAAGGTLGVTAVTFEQFSGAGQITAGAGMTKTGNTLNVGTASASRIVVGSDDIDLATTGIVAGTYRSVTVDAYGRVTNGTNPTTLAGYGITDAYTKTEVDSALALKLNLAGGTMSGAIAMGSNKITGLGMPTAGGDATTKTYVDTQRDTRLALAGGTMSGAIAMGANKITGLADPTNAQDAVTLNYVTTLYGSTASAAASAAAAASSESNAANSATSASNSATSASNSAAAAAASYDSFDDRYLGSKTSDPTVDNDGNPLIDGALYWNSTLGLMKAYKLATTSWVAAYVPSDFYLPLAGGTMTGNITLSAGTANGVAYLNGSKVLTTGSALTFDATNLVLGANKFIVKNAVGDGSGLQIYQAASDVSSIFNYYNGAIAFGVYNAEQMRLTSTGLGIGTSSPGDKIHAAAATAAGLSLQALGTGGSTWRILSTDNAASLGGGYLGFNNGSYRMVIDSSGNLGLGVTPSADWASSGYKAAVVRSAFLAGGTGAGLAVLGNNAYNDGAGWKYVATGNASSYVQNASAHAWNIAASGTAGDTITFTQAMTLDASGRLGIGTTSPAGPLHVVGGSDQIRSGDGTTTAFLGGSGSNGYTGTLTNHPFLFYTNSTERARIDSSGNLLVGTTTQQFAATCTVLQATANNAVYAAHNSATSGDNNFIWFGTEAGGTTRGTITYNRGAGLVAYNTTSDYRAKTVKGSVQNALEKVVALKPSTGRMNDAEQDIDFFVAHELQEVVPSAVTGEKDAVNEDGTPKYQMVDKSALIPLLTKAIQEQQAIIETLTARVATLESK